MNKKLILPAVLAAGVLVGGAIGASMVGSASAATPAPSSSTSTTSPSTGRWHSNTDPAHEAGESAAHKAAEAKGDATGVPPADFGGGPETAARPFALGARLPAGRDSLLRG